MKKESELYNFQILIRHDSAKDFEFHLDKEGRLNGYCFNNRKVLSHDEAKAILEFIHPGYLKLFSDTKISEIEKP